MNPQLDDDTKNWWGVKLSSARGAGGLPVLKATIIETGHEESTGYRGDIVGIYPANILYILYQ